MIKHTGKTQRTIRHTGKTQRTVDPKTVAEALGASVVERHPHLGVSYALSALRVDIDRRLRSTGGRPALEGATKRPKIPVKPDDWNRLQEIAGELSKHGSRSITPAQVASALIHSTLPTRSRPKTIGGVEGLSEHQVRAHTVLCRKEALDVKGIVQWTRMFPDLFCLWLIIPNFLDNEDRTILNTVLYNIRRGVQYVYFVRKEDIRQSGRFATLHETISAEVGEVIARTHVKPCLLHEQALLWLQTDIVIANPGSYDAVAFQYIRDKGKPQIAIRMDGLALGELIIRLKQYIDEHGEISQVRAFIPSTNKHKG